MAANFSTNISNYSNFDFSIGNYTGGIAFGGISFSFLTMTDELTTIGDPTKLNFEVIDNKIVILNEDGEIKKTIDINKLISANSTKINNHVPERNKDGFYIQEQDNTRVNGNQNTERLNYDPSVN
jgi:hypothetical protein